MEITFLTGNKNKLEEAQAILGDNFRIKNVDIDLPEIQEIDGRIVAFEKAKAGYGIIKSPLIVEDTSLYINAWNRLPGALIRWFLKTVGNEGILKMLGKFKDRTCLAQTVVVYNDGTNIETFEGLVSGKISAQPKGDNVFGWDKIFIPDGFNKTQAEMTKEEKNKISSRKIAFENLRKYLLKK